MQDAQQVYDALREIAALLRFTRESKFKIEAYEQGAEVVRTWGSELGARVEQDRLRESAGIGPALSRQIQELWNTGSSSLLERLRAQAPPGAAELIGVSGMTPRRISLLYEALGTTSVEDLHAACLGGRVRGVAGFGEKTERKLQQACEQYLSRRPATPPQLLLSEALELWEWLRDELGELAPGVEPAGALRRGEELLDELSVLIVADPEPIFARLRQLRRVLRVDVAARVAYLARGVVLRWHVTEPARRGNAWLEVTGNAEHVAAVAQRAAAHSVSLAEAPFDSEARLYAALGLRWVPPELRQGRDELMVAERDGFDDLIKLEDLRGFVHCHTTYSDGRASVLEMAQAAHALGMQYITITDHSPSAHYAAGVPLDRLKQQWDDIAAAQEVVPIRILRGTESDILSDGSLDYPDEVLERFDVIIASIHARHKQNREDMTARLRRALSLPIFKIWGHALGRILNHRDAIDCDIATILDTLAAAPGAIELNADPHRLDLPAALIPAARARGIPFVISVDAHSPAGLSALKYGVTQARRGGLLCHEVLNTLDAKSFAERVRPLGAPT